MSDFRANIHQIRFQLWLHSRPRWGAYSAPPNSQLDIKGHASKGREWKELRGGDSVGPQSSPRTFLRMYAHYHKLLCTHLLSEESSFLLSSSNVLHCRRKSRRSRHPGQDWWAVELRPVQWQCNEKLIYCIFLPTRVQTGCEICTVVWIIDCVCNNTQNWALRKLLG